MHDSPSVSEAIRGASAPSAWQLWHNPLLRRYMTSRLRWVPLLMGLLVTQVFGGFLWVSSFLVTLNLAQSDPGDGVLRPMSPEFHAALSAHGSKSAMVAWLLVLALQGMIWVVKGTFSVAIGVARESNEGSMESLRLWPMPVAQKVLGQLFGLPVRETVLVIALIPWAVMSVWLGDLPVGLIFRCYVLLATSAIFHHALGLVAGTVIRQKTLAATVSQVIVIVIHFVIPALGGFGLGVLSHISVEQAIRHQVTGELPHLFPEVRGSNPFIAGKEVHFFALRVDPALYQWIFTLGLLSFTLLILARRWRAADSLLLGKIGSVLLAAFILVLSCGELLPKIRIGGILDVVPNFRTRDMIAGVPEMRMLLAIGWLAVVGVASSVLAILLISTVTSAPEVRRRTIRQLRHHGRKSSVLWADGRASVLVAGLLALMCVAAWLALYAGLERAPDLRSGGVSWVQFDPGAIPLLAASVLVPALTWHAVLATRGWRGALLCGFLFGVVPLMIGFLGLLLSVGPDQWPKWVAGISGPMLPAYALVERSGVQIPFKGEHVLHLSLMGHAMAWLYFTVTGRNRLSPREAQAVVVPASASEPMVASLPQD